MEYWAFIALAMFDVGISFVSIGRFVADPNNSDFTDILTLMVAVATNIICALNVFSLDFISSSGAAVPYTGMAWAYGIFLGMGLLCVGLIFVALILIFKRLRVSKLYPPLYGAMH